MCGQGNPGSDLPANARLMGQLPQAELAELYRAADVFVLPSEGEGFPLAVQEALASGLPVITSDNAAIRETLGEDTALLVEREPGAVRAAIRALLNDPARCAATRRSRAQAGRGRLRLGSHDGALPGSVPRRAP